MEEQNQKLRSFRLELAVALINSTDGNKAVKQKVLKAICKADPVIPRILKTYGVDLGSSSKEFIVVCAADLSGTDKCPMNCQNCWYGGSIRISWIFNGQGYVQYFPSRDIVEQDLEELRGSGTFPNYSPYILAKMAALRKWLEKPKDIHCNFCDGELGDVEKQSHDDPWFAEYRTCLKCGYQWAKKYWAWLAKEQGVEA